jgi:hypothetical protein
MYLFPLELTELVPTKEGFGMSDNLRSRLREKNCFNPDPAPPDSGSGTSGFNEATKPPEMPTFTGSSGDSVTPASGTSTSGTGGTSDGTGSPPPGADNNQANGVCASIFLDEVGQSFIELFDTMDAQLNEFGLIIRRFEPVPTGWTFMEDIDAAKDALDSIKEAYTLSDGTKDKYESLVTSFQQFDTLIEKIKTNIKNTQDNFQKGLNSFKDNTIQGLMNAKQALDDEINSIQSGVNNQTQIDKENAIKGLLKTKQALDDQMASIQSGVNMNEPIQGFFTNPDVSDKETLRIASRAMQDGANLINGVEKSLTMFKNERGLYSGDLLEEYDRINDGKGLFAEKEIVARQKAETDAALAKTTAASAAAVQSAQNPDFFQSILNSIIYSDPTENPAFVYLNKPYQNATLEQVRQIVFYFIYAAIFGSIVYFLSTKTFVMPFFQTFLFWTKRYFVFIVWLLVVAMIYSFTTNWFMWLIREDIRYFAFVVDPTLHPGVHSIWNSKYKEWIKYTVYGLATLGFFLAAIFLTVIILFLILPLFLVLLWASGQLMSYFEKDELDE